MKYLIVITFVITLQHGHLLGQRVHVVPNSLIGKIAMKLNHTDRYAVTIGNFIFVSSPIDSFLNEPAWVRHEYYHTLQYKKWGLLGFLSKYLYLSIIYGYPRNPIEIQAEQFAQSPAN